MDSINPINSTNILITGGAGFIGANLVWMLLDRGYQVRVLDNFTAGHKEYLNGSTVEVLKADIRDMAKVHTAVQDTSAVVHLAAQTGVPGSLANPHLDFEVNVLGTLNLLEACRQVGVKRFIFASSNAPLGRQKPPAEESKVPLPISPYGASKLAGEAYCLAYHVSFGLGTVVLRFANVYGPYSLHKSSVVAKFFKDMVTGCITIDGDGQQTRDFIYVDDLCRAIVMALESSVAGEVFQIATGVETSIVELATLIQTITGNNLKTYHGPPRKGDILRNYSAIDKIRRFLGWEPEVTLEEGLRKTYAWLKSTQASHQL